MCHNRTNPKKATYSGPKLKCTSRVFYYLHLPNHQPVSAPSLAFSKIFTLLLIRHPKLITMKTTLLFAAALLSFSMAKAQFSENFEGSENSLTSNCWTLSGLNSYTDADVISGNGSLLAMPTANQVTVREILTPALNITNINFNVSFKFRLTDQLNGQATRSIEIGLLDVAGNYTSLQTLSLNSSNPATVVTFNQTFVLASAGVRKLSIRFSGTQGQGNARLIFDDLAVNASAKYGSKTCNSAPVAVNDLYGGLMGTTVSGNIMSNDNEPDGETMTASVVAASPDGTVVLSANGNFTFTPAPGFTGSQTTFTYQLNDGGFSPLNSNVATVTIRFFINIPLPIKLISFDAKYNKPDVIISWATAQEKNFSHFILEQSSDGINFKEVAVIMGSGESDSQKNYSYIDKSQTGKGGLVYYRLKSVDNDNKASNSSVRIIRLNDQVQTLNLITFPNPVANELRITLPGSFQNKKVVYELINTNGQAVRKMETNNSSQTETIGTGNLNSGFYILKVTCEGQNIQQKIIKQ